MDSSSNSDFVHGIADLNNFVTNHVSIQTSNFIFIYVLWAWMEPVCDPLRCLRSRLIFLW